MTEAPRNPRLPGTSANWHSTLWRGLAAEARNAARKIDESDVKLQTLMLAARYVAKAVLAERAERDQQSDEAK